MAADYSSCDPSNVADWLAEVGSEFTQYTYPTLKAGVDRHTLSSLNDHLLLHECAVHSGIHRMKILKKIEDQRSRRSRSGSTILENIKGDVTAGRGKQPIDVFLSYRRSNGSQLASLLKVHLQLRGFSVFIDIERLLAGKFDTRLLESVRQASYLVVVLTANALDRCIGDDEKEDWIHKEIATALEAGVTVIPVMEVSFHWPSADTLPEDIRHLPSYNGLRWIHDYQDACVDKLENFLRGQHDILSPQTTSLPPSPQRSGVKVGCQGQGQGQGSRSDADDDGDDDDDPSSAASPVSSLGSSVDSGVGGRGGRRGMLGKSSSLNSDVHWS